MGIVTKLKGITKHIMLSVVLGALQGWGGVLVVWNLEFGAKGEPVRRLCRFRTYTLLLGLSVGCQALGAAAWVFAVLGAERLICIRWSGFQGLCVGRKGELMICSLSPQHADSSLPLRFFLRVRPMSE